MRILSSYEIAAVNGAANYKDQLLSYFRFSLRGMAILGIDVALMKCGLNVHPVILVGVINPAVIVSTSAIANTLFANFE